MASASFAASDMTDLLQIGHRLHLQGDVDGALEVGRTLQHRFPEDPAGFVHNLNVFTTALSWDEENRDFDRDIFRLSDHLIEMCRQNTALTARELHACGQAQFSQSYLYGVRGESINAGRAAKRAKHLLDHALEVDPDLIDVRLHIGLINYYAQNLPPFAKLLGRILWLVPKSDADRSINFVAQVAVNGEGYRDSAKFILSDLYRQEGQLAQALPLLQTLTTTYPDNLRLKYNHVELLLDMQRTATAWQLLAGLDKNVANKPEFLLLKLRLAVLTDDTESLSEVASLWPEAPVPTWMAEQYSSLISEHPVEAMRVAAASR